MLLLLTLFACTPADKDTGDTGDSGDTGETDETGDSGDTGDTDDSGTDDFDLGFAFTGAWAGTSLAVVRLGIGDGLTFEEWIWEGAVDDARLYVTLPTPEEADLYTDPEWPEFHFGVYLVAVGEDPDTSGTHAESERWVTAGEVLAFWAQGTIPPELSHGGIMAGWNAVPGAAVLGGSPSSFLAWPPGEVPLEVPAVREELSMAGAVGDADVEGPMGLVLLPTAVFDEGTVDSLLYDAPVTDAFAFTLTGRPPEDHFADVDGTGNLEAVEVPFVYADGGETGWTDGDLPVLSPCYEGDMVVLWWLDRSLALDETLWFSLGGFEAGWNVLATPEKGDMVLVPTEAWSALDAVPGCGPF